METIGIEPTTPCLQSSTTPTSKSLLCRYLSKPHITSIRTECGQTIGFTRKKCFSLDSIGESMYTSRGHIGPIPSTMHGATESA